MRIPASQRLATALFGAVCGLLVFSTPAAAFVRSYTTQGCHPVFWAQSCVYLTVDHDGVPEMSLDDLERVIKESIQSWQIRTRNSSFLRLEYVAASIPREVAALDGLQVLKFRSDKWCRPPDEKTPMQVCYDPAAAALTTVTYVNKPMEVENDGRIVDADIEFNGVYNYFYDADTNPNPQTGTRKGADLWNTLTHELGHLQGLEHTCRRGSLDGMPACTRDSAGKSVINCSTVEQGRSVDPDLQAIYDTTMYPTADPKELKKRIPRADDLAGVITTYPISKDPHQCKVPEEVAEKGGCSLTSPLQRGSGATLLGGLILAMALLLRRRVGRKAL